MMIAMGGFYRPISRPTLLLLLTFSLHSTTPACTSNDQPDGGDLCRAVTCSGRGKCVVHGKTAECECEPGYYPSGLQCLSDSLVSNPITTAITGTKNTYNVGPGQSYDEPNTVPWGVLTAGDVVNIFHRETPYRFKLCLRGQGNASNPIVINGVTDASGKRPRFDFNGATTASGCNPGGGTDVFDTSSKWSLEDYAGIIIRPGTDDPYGYKPSWIEIRNLELFGAAPGATFTNLIGQVTNYISAPAGIWIQPSTDILIANCVIYDHAFGVFTMAKDNSLQGACERITLRSNRIYGNGVVGSDTRHNVYMQSTNPVVEGNFVGILRQGSLGSSYKSRSSGEIFRYNYVEASSRAIDWVYSEEQTPGIATQQDYGTDYAYGNIIVNDCTIGNCASSPIHYGGDNEGEQEDVTDLFVPTTPYRRHLYFYNNTVVHNVDSDDLWRTSIFDLSERGTLVEAWNNIFYLSGTSNFAWLDRSGDLRIVGTNLAFGTVAEARDSALVVNYSVSISGTLLNTNPNFEAPLDFNFELSSGSPADNAATGVPAGVTPNQAYAQLPVTHQPNLKSNGMTARSANDLGAQEMP